MRTVDVLTAVQELIAKAELDHPAAALNAKRYLNAAILQLSPYADTDVDIVLDALDIAVRNAKRRHINGNQAANGTDSIPYTTL